MNTPPSTERQPPASSPDPAFWNIKLAALLHDPPSKCLDIRTHEQASHSAMQAAGLDQQDYPRLPDWEASAADRLPFPRSLPSRTSCQFDGVRAAFHHPLGGGAELLKFPNEISDVDALDGVDGVLQPVLAEQGLDHWSEGERARARFFAHWRLWRQFARERDWRYAFLPADTRIPDHTIWHHMQVTSALAGCSKSNDPGSSLQPAFLKFQVGPVQDFISAARSTRDLWSGSYMLSWLMARGLWELAKEIGPDSVIYPSLWGQPLFDLQGRDELWSQVSLSDRFGAKKCWDTIKPSSSASLTPNLPNVFLALVPAPRAAELAGLVEAAMRQEFRRISRAVWNLCEGAGLCAGEGAISREQREERFNQQIRDFLSISWTVTPWPDTLEDCQATGEGFREDMQASKALKRVETVRKMAEEWMPEMDRDSRYFENEGRPDFKIKDPARLKNRGLAWSVLLARNSWQLDAVRQLRPFKGRTGGWTVGTANNKDHLTGRDEAVAGGQEWTERTKKEKAGGFWPRLFEHQDWMSAVTLVKRVWHKAYLGPVWGIPNSGGDFRMPNTHGLAAHEPFSNDDRDMPGDGERYFAVLAFDGDEIGKWVSGERTPPFRTQLADYSDAGGTERHGILEYFERGEERMKSFLDGRRPVSPSYHLQFSEALSNFALHCAAAIVEAHDGRLIYAGGDDVLALVPADSALACATDLNRAYRGETPARSVLPGRPADGKSSAPAEDDANLLSSPVSGFVADASIPNDSLDAVPLVVPGPGATASVGIAMAHFKAPLQDVVRAAMSAEKRAKSEAGRNAVAISIFKRSGEISHWDCKWNSGGLELYESIREKLASGDLSGRFPHQVCQLLTPYLTSHADLHGTKVTEDFPVADVIQREVGIAAERQSNRGKGRDNRADLLKLVASYVEQIQEGVRDRHATPDKEGTGQRPDHLLNQLPVKGMIGLCTAVAFAHRNRSGQGSSKTRASAPVSA